MRKNSVKNTRINSEVLKELSRIISRERPKNRSDDFCCVCGSSSGFKDL